MMGITSKVLKEYFVSQGDNSNQISITVPFTYKVIPQRMRDYTYGNQFISMTIYLKLIDNLDLACEMAKRLADRIKKSTQPIALKTLLEFYAYFMPAAFNSFVT